MRVLIDRDLCQGNAVCTFRSPAVFELGDDELAAITRERLEPDDLPSVESAIRACPMQAISLGEK
jgi:ferredoxin